MYVLRCLECNNIQEIVNWYHVLQFLRLRLFVGRLRHLTSQLQLEMYRCGCFQSNKVTIGRGCDGSPWLEIETIIVMIIFENNLTYVGVSWFVFHVLQLLLIRFTQQTHVAIANPR